MKTKLCLLALFVLSPFAMMVAQKDHIVDGMTSVASIAGETKTVGDSVKAAAPEAVIPMWKQKLYYGYNFDIYFHHDSRSDRKENGWSIALSPEVGWKLTERIHLGLRLSGSYANSVTTYDMNFIDTTYSTDLRIHQGAFEIAPYMRYRMKTLFDGKVGIWLEARVFTGMEFPRVTDGIIKGTDYDGLKHSINYGFQISPVVTYKFNKKSTFQIFFSILSLGYSGMTYCYRDPLTGERYKEHTHDVIIFSGKLRNMLANQFTPGLYGLRFGVQKSF